MYFVLHPMASFNNCTESFTWKLQRAQSEGQIVVMAIKQWLRPARRPFTTSRLFGIN